MGSDLEGEEETAIVRLEGEWARIADQVGRRPQRYLLAIGGPRVGERHRLGAEMVIGCDESCTLQLSGEGVSRHHLRIGGGPHGSFVVEDLGSRNGTMVNGHIVEQHTLATGDLLQVGAAHVFLFVQQSALEDLILQEQRWDSLARITGAVGRQLEGQLALVLTEITHLRESLQRGFKSRGEALDMLQAMENATRHGMALGERLGFSRTSHVPVRRPVKLASLADEVVGLLRPSFEATVLRVEIPPDLTLIGDAALLHQALLTLCVQACEQLPAGGAVAIRAEAPDPLLQPGPAGEEPYVVLTIHDTGPGYDDRASQDLFEPLFDSSRGHGRAGLAAVYRAARQHGGRVEVESAPGWGTTFRLLLPSGLAAATAEEGPSPAPARPVTRTIMLVEDEESERARATAMLEQMGFRVVQACDGREAIRLFTLHRPEVDLVLLDMILPNLSGKETFRWLRRVDGQVKVLLTSGYLDAGRVRDLLATGACWFVPKPYDVSALSAMVTQALLRGG